MTTQSSYILLLVGSSIGFIIIIGAIVYLLVLIRNIQSTFGKLGYIVREDAKKYFDDAASKLIETNEEFHDQYKNIVIEGTRVALNDSGKIMEVAIADAQKEASRIIVEAQKSAQNIDAASKKNSQKYFRLSIDNSVQAIGWTMEQYIGETFSEEDHERIIRKLMKAYINERQ